MCRRLCGSLLLLWLSLLMIWAATIPKQKHRPSEADNPYALESDMILTPDQLHHLFSSDHNDTQHRFKRKAVVHDVQRWPRGVLVYEFDPDLSPSLRQHFLAAVQLWSSVTCVQFREYTGPSAYDGLGHSARLVVAPGSGCLTAIGFPGSGASQMQLSDNCMGDFPAGVVAHELGHALGFYHEQSRADRDDHVTVISENIKPGGEVNFMKVSLDDARVDEPYDYGSLMHYGANYLSKDDNNLMTLVPKKMSKRPSMGQREQLSYLDIKTMNELYQCQASCPDPGCQNGGYINYHCRCNCPNGFTGTLCKDPLPSTGASCGGKLTATFGTFTSPGYSSEYPGNLDCHWIIEGPPGSSISLRLEDIDIEEEFLCYFDWLEVRDEGPIMPGSRYCGTLSKVQVEHDSNVLYLRLHSDADNGGRGFKASYTIDSGAGWLPWGQWSACTKACGGGSRSRLRSCPSNRCHGNAYETTDCNGQNC